MIFRRNCVFSIKIVLLFLLLCCFKTDSENDKILICCEEDFRLFMEHTKENRSKIFIKIPEPLKGPADEKKKALKRSKRSSADGTKSVKRCEKIRKLFASIDPASLCESSSCKTCKETKSVINGCALSDYHVSPEAVKILSATISECLKPCHYINTILNEIHTMFSNIDGSFQQIPQTTQAGTTQAETTNDTSNVPTAEPEPENVEQEVTEPEKVQLIDETLDTSSFIPENDDERFNAAEIENRVNMSSLTLFEVSTNMEPAKIEQETEENLNEVVVIPVLSENISSHMTRTESIESLSSVEVCGSNSNIDEDSREWTILDAVNDDSDSDGKSSVSDENEAFVEVHAEYEENKEDADKQANEEQQEILPAKENASEDLNITDDHFGKKSFERSIDPSIETKISENIEALSSSSGQKIDAQNEINLNLIPEVIVTSTPMPQTEKLDALNSTENGSDTDYDSFNYNFDVSIEGSFKAPENLNNENSNPWNVNRQISDSPIQESPSKSLERTESAEVQENLNNGVTEGSLNRESLSFIEVVEVERQPEPEPMQYDEVNNNNDNNNNDPIAPIAPMRSYNPTEVLHSNQRINAAIHTMLQMGFDNDGMHKLSAIRNLINN